MSDWQRFELKRPTWFDATTHLGLATEQCASALARYLAAVADVAEYEPAQDRTLGRNVDRYLVRDVMTRRVVFVAADATFPEILDMLARHRISAVPVVDDELKVVGVVSESDLLARVVTGGDSRARIGDGQAARVQARRDAREETARELMNSPVVTAGADASVVHAARVAAAARVRLLPVVGESGVLLGVLTRSDLLRLFRRDDKEIRAHLIDLFARRFGIDASAVEVEVCDGVVTLSGEVDGQPLITSLVDAARATTGVVAVEDLLAFRVDDLYR